MNYDMMRRIRLIEQETSTMLVQHYGLILSGAQM